MKKPMRDQSRNCAGHLMNALGALQAIARREGKTQSANYYTANTAWILSEEEIDRFVNAYFSGSLYKGLGVDQYFGNKQAFRDLISAMARQPSFKKIVHTVMEKGSVTKEERDQLISVSRETSLYGIKNVLT